MMLMHLVTQSSMQVKHRTNLHGVLCRDLKKPMDALICDNASSITGWDLLFFATIYSTSGKVWWINSSIGYYDTPFTINSLVACREVDNSFIRLYRRCIVYTHSRPAFQGCVEDRCVATDSLAQRFYNNQQHLKSKAASCSCLPH